MLKHRLAILLVTLSLVVSSCRDEKTATYPHRLQFFTEEYKPFNYTESGILKGLAPEIVSLICYRLGIPFEANVMDWDQAYNQAKTNPEAVLFATILTPERKDLFQWVGPIASVDWRFYSASNNPMVIQSLDDARNVQAVGVIRDFSIEEFLVNEGFTNLVYVANTEDGFEKLLNGTIQLFPSLEITTRAAMEKIGHSIFELKPQLSLQTSLVYIAFNKSVPKQVVSDFQQELNHLKINGSMEALYQRYMESTGAPGMLQFYTEQYPPLSFRNTQGEITGFGTDVVKEIMRRNQRYYDIRLSLWSNGYQLALHNPNFCLFTMDRTEIRESLFQWVGPIGTNSTYFYVKNGSGVSIGSIDDARNLSAIGTVSSWFSDQYLREKGFTNLIASDDPGDMVRKLFTGEVQAIVCSNITIADILRENGFSYSQLNPTISLLSSDFYIAFSLNTDQEIVAQWQNALSAIKSDGTYQAIHSRWFAE